MPPYKESFLKGSTVRIAAKEELEDFRDSWKYHHPLQESQMAFSNTFAVVRGVGFYHGGDALYSLENIPGLWHEVCLRNGVDFEQS